MIVDKIRDVSDLTDVFLKCRTMGTRLGADRDTDRARRPGEMSTTQAYRGHPHRSVILRYRS